jgi:SAM-dependent methyltransferase
MQQKNLNRAGMSTKNITGPEELRVLLNAFQRSRIILTALELNIFSHIEAEGSTSEDVAAKINSNPRATDRLMSALCALGLLEKKQQSYFHTAFSASRLDRSSDLFLHGLFHHIRSWESWSHLTAAVKTGKNPALRHFHDSKGGWTEAFIAAMHERAMPQAQQLAELFSNKDISCFLDVGGGSGAYTIALLKKFPQARACIFDLPGVVPIARKYIEKEGLLQRTDFIEGDYNRDDFGKDYDLIFMSAIIHINAPGQNQKLIKKAAAALTPGGMLAIQDHVMAEDRTEPLPGALFSLHMLVSTECGDTYTENELRTWMHQVGLQDFQRKETRNNALLTAEKPGH